MTANFALVPSHYRVRTMAVANVLWSVVIDFMAHRSQPRAKGEEGMRLTRTRSQQRVQRPIRQAATSVKE